MANGYPVLPDAAICILIVSVKLGVSITKKMHSQ